MIYDRPVRLLFREMVEDMSLLPGTVFSRDDAVAWFASKYPLIKKGTIYCHLSRLSVNSKNRLHHNPKPDEDDLLFELSRDTFRLYAAETDPPPIRPSDADGECLVGSGDADDGLDSGEVALGSSEFALEKDLRNYLVKNLCVVEQGLELYEDEGVTGIEFPVGGRFVDVLAVDRNGGLVVIELKVSKGYDRVIGQTLRYMAWVQENLADPEQNVRGVIVARHITEDLKLASSYVPNIELYEYQMSLTLEKVVSDKLV